MIPGSIEKTVGNYLAYSSAGFFGRFALPFFCSRFVGMSSDIRFYTGKFSVTVEYTGALSVKTVGEIVAEGGGKHNIHIRRFEYFFKTGGLTFRRITQKRITVIATGKSAGKIFFEGFHLVNYVIGKTAVITIIIVDHTPVKGIARITQKHIRTAPFLHIRNFGGGKSYSRIVPTFLQSFVGFIFFSQIATEFFSHPFAGIRHAVSTERHTVTGTAAAYDNTQNTTGPRLFQAISGHITETFFDLFQPQLRCQRRRIRIPPVFTFAVAFYGISGKFIRMLLHPFSGSGFAESQKNISLRIIGQSLADA